MPYLVGGDFEKNSGSIKNCGRWSDILDEMFPEIALLTSVFGILAPPPVDSVGVCSMK